MPILNIGKNRKKQYLHQINKMKTGVKSLKQKLKKKKLVFKTKTVIEKYQMVYEILIQIVVS